MNNRRVKRSIAFLLAIATLAFVFFSWLHSRPIPFDAIIWKKAASEQSLRNVRYRMVSDLQVKLNARKPITIEEVRDLLGNGGQGEQWLRYYIGGVRYWGLIPSQGWVLDLLFDKNRQLIDFDVSPE